MRSTHTVTGSIIGLLCCAGLALASCAQLQPPQAPAAAPAVVTADPRFRTRTGEPTAAPQASSAAPTLAPALVPGAPANSGAGCMCISAGGRYVAFSSNATNLVPGDTDEDWHLFVHDRVTGETERVSVATGGGEGHGDGFWPGVTGNGRWVAFDSVAGTLAPANTDGSAEVFLRDRESGRTELVSMGLGGVPAGGSSDRPAVPAGGRYIAFASNAGNLVPEDAPGGKTAYMAYYVYDHEAEALGSTEVSADGRWELYSVVEPYPTPTPGPLPKIAPGVPPSWTTLYLRERASGQTREVARFLARWRGGVVCGMLGPTLSADGRWVAYMAPGGHELGFYGVFLYDRESGTSQQVVGADGAPPDGDAEGLSISADGRFVAFTTLARNLVPEMATRGMGVYVYDRETGAIERVDVASK